MSTDPHQRLARAFSEARALSPEERERYLERLAEDEPGLASELASLLRHADDPEDPLEQGAEGSWLVAEAAEASPARTGRGFAPPAVPGYRVLRLLGEGGMGAVFEAEQERPRRRVALKVLPPLHATPTLVRRFEREAELLGRLQHPGIVRIHEARLERSSAGGDLSTAFFAMDLVDGRPITEHAAASGLSIEDRLRLVSAVCDAVQHAHDRGVVHRDLKPANILVDGEGRPRVLDFGIARAVDEEDAGEPLTALTRTGQLVGTLDYMSPEVARGEADVDGRADVYALGVLLHELLTGKLPGELSACTPAEALMRIRSAEWEPVWRHDASLRGDLTVIVGTALHPDRDRRYASAAALATDLRRYLDGEAIVARPPTVGYLASRFVQRYRVLVGATALTLLALTAGLVVAVRASRIAADAAAAAEERSLQARRSSYLSGIRAAATHLRDHDAALAASVLDSLPEELRGWEHRLLVSQVDDSSAVLDEPDLFMKLPVFDELGESAWFRTRPERGHDLRRWHPRTGAVEPVAVLGRRPAAVPERALPLAMTRLLFEAPGEQRVFVSPDDGSRTRLVKPCEGPFPARLAALASRGSLMVLEDPGSPWRVCDWSDGSLVEGVSGVDPTDAGWAFSRDGRRLAWADQSGALVVQDLAGGRPVALQRPASAADPVSSLLFGEDPSTVYTADRGGTVAAWDTDTGELRGRLPVPGRGVPHLAASSDGELLAAAVGGTLSLLDAELESVRAVGHAPEPGRSFVVFGPRDEQLITVQYPHQLRLWRVADLAGVPPLRPPGGGAYEAVMDLAVAPGDRFVAALEYAGAVTLHDPATSRELGRLESGGRRDRGAGALALRPDGERAAIALRDGAVELWDPATRRRLERVELGESLGARRIVHAAPGWLVSSDEEPAQLLELDTLETLWTVPGSLGAAIAVSADGLRAALASGESEVTVWDLGRREVVVTLRPPRPPVVLAFAEDGERLLVGDQELSAWSLSTGEELARVAGHGGSITDLALSPDGTRFATAGELGAVRVWAASDLALVLELRAGRRPVTSVAWSSDGEWLFAGSRDGSVRRWGARPAP